MTSYRLINKLYFCAVLLSLLCMSCSDDTDTGNTFDAGDMCLVEVNGSYEDLEVDRRPEFLDGGQVGFAQAMLSTVKYPAEARENGIEGKTVVQYVIYTDGSVQNINIIENPGSGLGETTAEALALVTVGQSFSPALLDGNPVNVQKEMILTYSIE